jgi:hypothetical protein
MFAYNPQTVESAGGSNVSCSLLQGRIEWQLLHRRKTHLAKINLDAPAAIIFALAIVARQLANYLSLRRKPP